MCSPDATSSPASSAPTIESVQPSGMKPPTLATPMTMVRAPCVRGGAGRQVAQAEVGAPAVDAALRHADLGAPVRESARGLGVGGARLVADEEQVRELWIFTRRVGYRSRLLRLFTERVGDAVGLERALEVGDAVTHHDQVVEAALAVLDVVLEQRLGAKAQALEGRDGALLVERHARHHLLDAAAQRRAERLLRQQAAEALAPVVGRHQHPQLGDVRRPRQRVAVDGAVADDRAAALGEDGERVAGLDVAQPVLDHVELRDVAAQEEQVVLLEVLGEAQHRLGVERAHVGQRHVDAADVTQRGVIGISLQGHSDRSESQVSIFGHSRCMALAPATRLTWPPFNMTSVLSALPAIGTSARDAS